MFSRYLMSCVALAGLLSASTLVAAPPDKFDPAGVGGGGAMYSPTINPHNGDEMYVACDMSLQFLTTDAGKNWEVMDFRDFKSGHDTAVRFTRDPMIRWAVNSKIEKQECTRPCRSTDGGKTWQFPPNDESGWPTFRQAYIMYNDYANPDRAMAVGDYRNLYTTFDGGKTWAIAYKTASDQGLHLAGAFYDGDTVYIGTNVGVFISKDGGKSFTADNTPGLPKGAIMSFAGAKTGGKIRFYAITHKGAWAGITGGDRWGFVGLNTLDVGDPSWVDHSSAFTDKDKPFFVKTDGTDIQTAYIAGGGANGKSGPTVHKTTDGGKTWTEVFLLEGNRNIICGYSGDKGDFAWSYGEYALGFDVCPGDSNRLIISDLGFAHISTDGGKTWRQVYTQPSDDRKPGPIPPKASYRSIGMDMTSIWNLDWFDDQNIFASATDIRGFRSADGGKTWSFDYVGHDLNTMYRIAQDKAKGIAYAATSSVHDMYNSTFLADARIDNGKGRLLYTTDKGKTWKLMKDFGAPLVWVALDPKRPERLYVSVVSSKTGGIFMTDNRSQLEKADWVQLAKPPRTQGHPFNVMALDDGSLVCTYSGRRDPREFTASSGVFLSTDDGKTWEDRSADGMKFWAADLLVDPNDKNQNTWLAGVYYAWGGATKSGGGASGLYRSRDRGRTWTQIAGNNLSTMSVLNVYSGAFRPNNTKEFYMTTEYDGVLWTPDITADRPEFKPVPAYRFAHPVRILFSPTNPNQMWVTNFGNGINVGMCK